MTGRLRGPSRDGLSTALVSMSAALGLLVGTRAVVAVELPGLRPLLGMEPLPRETLGLVWSPRASWPADFQEVALERMLALVAALLLAAVAVAVLNALVLLVDSGAARRRELAVHVALGAAPAAAARLLLGPVRTLLATALVLGLILGMVTGGALRASWPALHGDLALVSALGELLLPLVFLVGAAAGAYAAVGVRLSFGGGLAYSLGHGGRLSDDRGATALRRALVALQMGAAGTVVVAGFLLAGGLFGGGGPTGTEAGPAVVPVTLPAPLEAGGWRPVLAALGEVPGLEAESLSTQGTLSGVGVRDYVTAECGNCFRGGLPMPFWSAYADHYAVGPGFFRLAGFRLSEGRGIGPGDHAGSEPVAVVNRTFANTAFENGEPLGRKIRVGRGLDAWFTVVGVVEDRPAAAPGARDRPGEAVYLSLLQQPPRSALALLQGDDAAVEEARELLSALALAPGDARRAAAHLKGVRAPQRWAAGVAAFLAALILALALFGTRVVAAQIVRRSTHDLAIRRALGAGDGRIVRHVLAGSARSGLWGAAVSVFFGSLMVGLLRKALGGLSVPGPLPYLAVAALLTVTAMAASWGAARAATRVPPAAALQ